MRLLTLILLFTFGCSDSYSENFKHAHQECVDSCLDVGQLCTGFTVERGTGKLSTVTCGVN